MKFILLVEGDVEFVALPEFLKRWLDPRLDRRIGVKAINLSGSGEYVKEVVKMAAKQLNSPQQYGIIAVIGLLDLYGLPRNFCPDNISGAEDCYSWAKQELEKRVGHSRFRQFFAVHETEAWLLSDPGIFPREVGEAFPSVVTSPESVNFNQPPARLLEKLYQQKLRRSYRKKVDGRNLFSKLDPGIAYQKCPRLKEMLDEMLKLAKDRGN